MDYENKRNEEIIRATQLLECGDITRESLEYIFPELRESEDEKIRKVIRGWIYAQPTSFFDNGISKEEMLAWLENKGEQNSTPPKWKYKKDKTPLLRDSIILNKYGCVGKSPSGAIVSDVWILDYDELAKLPKEEIEKQGEQTSIIDIDGILTATNYDKMFQSCKVHKFNVGDWITDGYLHCKISDILDDRYIVDTTELAKRRAIPFKYEDNYHLWTIQDAKGGDVFATKTGGIFIYKELLYDKPFAYCGVDKFGVFKDCNYGDGLDWTPYLSDVTPATNEQRNTLFAKMKEAGYEWDEEKKVLKKIEQNSIDKVEPKFNIGDTMRTLKEASKGITDGMPVVVSIDDEYYHCTNELIAIKDQDDYEFPPINMKQKPADKVAPKFKIGDFIVNNDSGDICQVTEIRDDEYCLWPLDAEIKGYLRFIDVDNEYHLWTIQDAKDGDVLAYVTDEEDLWIMIYWSLYEPYEGHVHYHALLVNDDFYDKGTCCICIDDLKPANKEQRNTLFAKMTEAGYEWDAEKKELKKIEHLRERYENIAQSEWFKRTHNGMSVSDEEPKWTKEDDERQISITEYLNELYDDNRFSLDELTDLKTWLKSLKQRIGWKPNKEQIKALHDLNLVGNISYVGQAQLLIELYNDLKKLIV